MKTVKTITVFLLLLFATIQGTAQQTDLDQKVHITFDNIPIKEALLQLEKATNVSFAFSEFPGLNQNIQKVYQNKPLRIILTEILKAADANYKLIGNTITIYSNRNSEGNLSNDPSGNKTPLTFSGYVYDSNTGEALIGANVYDKESKKATSTNAFGFFSLSLKPGEHTVVISYLSYESMELNISKSQQISLKLQPAENILNTVEITARETDKNAIQSVDISRNTLSTTQIKNIPALGGEADALKALSLLPGVKSGEEGTAGFYVRGGGIDQNLILMDGIPLYNPYHLFGYLSTFNSDAINHIQIVKGGFPARYGSRLSSVVDITMNEGNNQEWKTKISAGLVSAKATTSGPIIKGKSALFFSARRSYMDLIYTPIARVNAPDKKLEEKYNMMDFNLKWNYKFSNKDRIFFSSYFSRDLLLYDEASAYNNGNTDQDKTDATWKNGIASLRWNHLYNDKLFSNTTLYFTNYSYNFDLLFRRTSTRSGLERDAKQTKDVLSTINDIGLKQDYAWYLNQDHTIRFGLAGIRHQYEVGVASFRAETDRETIQTETTERDTEAMEFSLYAEDEFAVGNRLNFNIGLHAASYLVGNKQYFSLQPRLNARFAISEKVSLKLAYAQMAQYIHLLTSGGLIYKTDFWIPTTESIKPESSNQFTLGTAFQLGEDLQLEVEGYYKTLHNLTDYKPGASLLTHRGSWEGVVATGDGESYGAELFLQKTKGKLTGWLGYTLSWALRTFDGINFGTTYYDTYDRRHDISIVANYAINHKWSLNATWVFATGGYTTQAYESYTTPGYNATNEQYELFFNAVGTTVISTDSQNPSIVYVANSKNNFRLPNYHRLDIGASRIKMTKGGHLSELRFGLINVYNHFNPTFFREKTPLPIFDMQPRQPEYEAVALFPISPSFTYSITF